LAYLEIILMGGSFKRYGVLKLSLNSFNVCIVIVQLSHAHG